MRNLECNFQTRSKGGHLMLTVTGGRDGGIKMGKNLLM